MWSHCSTMFLFWLNICKFVVFFFFFIFRSMMIMTTWIFFFFDVIHQSSFVCAFQVGFCLFSVFIFFHLFLFSSSFRCDPFFCTTTVWKTKPTTTTRTKKINSIHLLYWCTGIQSNFLYLFYCFFFDFFSFLSYFLLLFNYIY